MCENWKVATVALNANLSDRMAFSQGCLCMCYSHPTLVVLLWHEGVRIMPPWILNQQLIFLSFPWEHVCSWIIWAKLLSLSCLKQGGYGGHMVHLQIGARASYHSKVILHLHTGSRYGPTFCSPAPNNVRPTWHHFSLLCPYCTLSYITVRPLHFCYCFIKCM